MQAPGSEDLGDRGWHPVLPVPPVRDPSQCPLVLPVTSQSPPFGPFPFSVPSVSLPVYPLPPPSASVLLLSTSQCPPDPFQCPYFQSQCPPVAPDPLPVLPVTLRSLIANVPDPFQCPHFYSQYPLSLLPVFPVLPVTPRSLSVPPVPLPVPQSPSHSSHPSQLPPGSSPPADGVWSPGGHAAAGGCGAAPGPGGCFLNGVGVTRGRIHPVTSPHCPPVLSPLPALTAVQRRFQNHGQRPVQCHGRGALGAHGKRKGGVGEPQDGYGRIWGLWSLGGYGETWGNTEGIGGLRFWG